MRNDATWMQRVHPQICQSFPPRIQEDLIKIPRPVTSVLPEGSYYIYGPVGTGKTIWAVWQHIEACRQRYLAGKRMNVTFVKTSELFYSFRKRFEEREGVDDLLYEMSHVSYLTLDDFGVEKPADWVINFLYLIIDRRYEQLLPTVITSNFSLQQSAQRLGDDRIMARIERMCRVIHKKEVGFK